MVDSRPFSNSIIMKARDELRSFTDGPSRIDSTYVIRVKRKRYNLLAGFGCGGSFLSYCARSRSNGRGADCNFLSVTVSD
jgi:hypothetical protein